jgi:hypothetical protein
MPVKPPIKTAKSRTTVSGEGSRRLRALVRGETDEAGADEGGSSTSGGGVAVIEERREGK